MITLVWQPSFARDLKRRIRRDPALRSDVESILRQMAEDPFHPSLRSHKLKGQFQGTWACSVTYNLRIIFEPVQNPATGEDELLLLAFGSHDEVY